MTLSIALIHNPLLGPTSWRPTAEVLAKGGHQIILPSLGAAMAGPGPYYSACAQAVAKTIGQAAPKEGVVLAVHAAASSLLAALIGASPAPVRAAIFVDSEFTHAGRSWLESRPIEVTEMITGLAKEGRLPKWDQWWLQSNLADAVQDKRVREALLTELVQAPLAYFHERAPPNDPVKGVRIGYLLLSEHNRPRLEDARWMRWLVREEMTGHLGSMNHPDRVAAALEALASDLVTKAA